MKIGEIKKREYKENETHNLVHLDLRFISKFTKSDFIKMILQEVKLFVKTENKCKFTGTFDP